MKSLGRSALALALLAALAVACAQIPIGGVEPLRISDVANEGDPQRRASMSLILNGLSADQAQQWARAEGFYERAIQLDSTNPFAFLALARHRIERAQARPALDALGRAQSLLPGDDPWISQRVEPHLLGLRARALFLTGKLAQSTPMLERARELAPGIWGDGTLSAAELR